MSAIADALLDHHLTYRPVDASFMGLRGHDHRLPPAGAGTAASERRDLAALRIRIDASDAGDSLGTRLDHRLAQAQLIAAEAALDHFSRFGNPAWYTGEAAFGIIGLLLPAERPTPVTDIRARLAAIPDFLADGRAQLSTAAAPRGQTERAIREAAATAAFLRGGIRLYADWHDDWMAPAERAAQAFDAFATAIEPMAATPTACGSACLETLMRAVHGFDFGPDAAIRLAERQFAAYGEELDELVARVDPNHTAAEIVEGLTRRGVTSPDAVVDRYRLLDAETRLAAAPLVTTADDYRLHYRPVDPCFREVSRALYFLPYRSPPAAAAGGGSIYWVGAPPEGATDAYLRANCDANIRIIQAVHHGSLGHHTQNARARAAASPLARVAGTDCALGLAFPSAGTMVEGWACYVQDLMAEAPGFYTPAELVYLKQMERRNVASVFVDIRLHTGEWSPAQAAAFYRDEGGFAPERVHAEITRNGMMPASRLMYALGVDAIRDLRRRWRGSTRDFHDTLIGHGHVPVAWAGDEMARAGLLT